MKPTRLPRDLRFVSMVVLSGLALQTSAWGQEAEKPTAPAATTQNPAPTPAPAAQPAAPTGEAEATPPPPPSAQPIPPPPANRPEPGYGPPPGVPYHYYYNYPTGYTEAPARPVTYRPFMFGIGLGMGALTYSSSSVTKHESAMAYGVHLGFSITSRWMVMLAMDGSWGQFDFNDRDRDPTLPYGKVSAALSSYTAGAQMFILRWLYARVGLGFACLEWSDNYSDSSDCRGQAGVAAVGAEFLQTRSTALAAELGGFAARFPDAMTVDDRNDVWYNIGANLVLNLF